MQSVVAGSFISLEGRFTKNMLFGLLSLGSGNGTDLTDHMCTASYCWCVDSTGSEDASTRKLKDVFDSTICKEGLSTPAATVAVQTGTDAHIDMQMACTPGTAYARCCNWLQQVLVNIASPKDQELEREDKVLSANR